MSELRVFSGFRGGDTSEGIENIWGRKHERDRDGRLGFSFFFFFFGGFLSFSFVDAYFCIV